MALMDDPQVGSGAIDPTATALAFFVDKGYSPAQASGIVGNLLAESNLNTGAVGDGGISKGVAQWNGGRLSNLRNFASKAGADPNDLMTQLEFVHHELKGSEGAANQRLLGTGTPEGSALAFLGFERPKGWTAANPAGGHNSSGRIANAQASLPLAQELAQNKGDGALITAQGPQAGAQTAGSIGVRDPETTGSIGGGSFSGGMMGKPYQPTEEGGSPMLQAIGMALATGNRLNPLGNFATIYQGLTRERQTAENQRYGRWNDDRNFTLRQQEAARAQGNTDRSFGMQEKQLALATDKANAPETRQLADGSTVRIDNDGKVTQITPPIRQLNEVEKRRQDADTFGLTGEARNNYILNGKYEGAANGANPYANPGGGKTTGEQDKSAGFSDRMFQNESVVRQHEALGTSRVEQGLVSKYVPGFVGSAFNSDDFKKYDAAKQNWIAAQLRKESGAAIGADEYAAADKQYFPQPGDPAAVIAQKRELRATATKGMARDGGPGYRPPMVFDEKGELQPYGAAQRAPAAAPAQAQPSAPANAPRVSSQAEYDALPTGAQYVDPNGTLRTKKGR